jgi:excisionase family DNA binding protein
MTATDISTTQNRPKAPSAGHPALQLVYTVQEAAEALRIGYSTARERVRTGELRSFKDGSRRLIAGDDLLAYVQARVEEGHGFDQAILGRGTVFQRPDGRWVA